MGVPVRLSDNSRAVASATVLVMVIPGPDLNFVVCGGCCWERGWLVLVAKSYASRKGSNLMISLPCSAAVGLCQRLLQLVSAISTPKEAAHLRLVDTRERALRLNIMMTSRLAMV